MFKEYNGIQVQVVLDKFNSEHFGFQMGNMSVKLTDGAINAEAVEEAITAGLEDARREGFRHLTCKMDTAFKPAVFALQKQEFLLVDTLMTYYFDLRKGTYPEITHRCELGDCREEDVPRLKEIAKASFTFDRFHSDPVLPNELCDQYYEKWFENSWRGYADKIVVGYVDGVPVGFATAKYSKEEPYVHFVLAAVAAEARGNGVFSSIRWAEMQWAAKLAQENPQIQGVMDGTQINNLAVQRTWIKFGFTIQGSQYVFQRMI